VQPNFWQNMLDRQPIVCPKPGCNWVQRRVAVALASPSFGGYILTWHTCERTKGCGARMAVGFFAPLGWPFNLHYVGAEYLRDSSEETVRAALAHLGARHAGARGVLLRDEIDLFAVSWRLQGVIDPEPVSHHAPASGLASTRRRLVARPPGRSAAA
jgi:hypothetical protein